VKQEYFDLAVYSDSFRVFEYENVCYYNPSEKIVFFFGGFKETLWGDKDFANFVAGYRDFISIKHYNGEEIDATDSL
jgi:hypothetical protein